jgi:tetratricopeptide (TPR) repeat protein
MGEHAADLAAVAGDRRTELLAGLILAEARGHTDQRFGFQEIRTQAERIEAELATTGSDHDHRKATIVLGRLAFFEGRAGEARDVAEKVLEDPEGLSQRERMTLAMALVGNGYFGGEPVEETLARVPRALEVLADSPGGEASVLRVRGALLGMLGRLDESRSDLRRADEMLGELGAPFRGIVTRQMAGEAAHARGDYEEAVRIFREAHDYFNATGETGFNSTTAALLALSLGELGRFGEAEEKIERSREMTNEDDFASQALWRVAMSLVESNRGNHEEAVDLARKAIDFTEPTDYLPMKAQAHETLGRVLAAAGRAEEAREAYERSVQRYEQKGDLVSSARLRDRLASL